MSGGYGGGSTGGGVGSATSPLPISAHSAFVTSPLAFNPPDGFTRAASAMLSDGPPPPGDYCMMSASRLKHHVP